MIMLDTSSLSAYIYVLNDFLIEVNVYIRCYLLNVFVTIRLYYNCSISI